MKNITKEQLEAITKLIYDLRCPAPEWEAFKKLISELPVVEEKVEETK